MLTAVLILGSGFRITTFFGASGLGWHFDIYGNCYIHLRHIVYIVLVQYIFTAFLHKIYMNNLYIMEPVKTVVKSGKYTFQITDNTFLYEGEIYSRNFKIGGRNSDCVNVSISYKDYIPTAYIPYVVHDPMCSIDMPLDSGRGTIIMIKTLLNYIHSQISTIPEVTFEDKSNIECATDYEITKNRSIFRKQGSHIYPIPLYYFSIAFNGETWYENHFNARQKDHKKHSEYKMKINTLLNEPETKSAISFLQFLQMTAPPMETTEEL
jgi:hypothetical protein